MNILSRPFSIFPNATSTTPPSAIGHQIIAYPSCTSLYLISGSAAGHKPKDILLLPKSKAKQENSAEQRALRLQSTSTEKARFALRRVHTF
jgi:hypothetical protein